MTRDKSKTTSNGNSNTIYWNYYSQRKKREIKALCPIPNTNILVTLGKGEKEVRLHEIYQRADPLVTTIRCGNDDDNNINCLDTHMFKAITGSKESISYVDFTTCEVVSKFNNVTKDGDARVVGCKFMNEALICTWAKDNTFSLYDVRQPNNDRKPYVFQFTGENGFTCASYSGNYITTGNEAGRVVSLDLRNSKLISDKVSNFVLTSLESYKQDIVVVSDSNGAIVMYDLGTGKILSHHEMAGEAHDSDDDDDYDEGSRGRGLKYNAQFIPTSGKIINGTDRGEVQVSSLKASPGGKLPYSLTPELPFVVHSDADEKSKKINIIKYDKTKNRLVASAMDGQIHVWDKLVL